MIYELNERQRSLFDRHRNRTLRAVMTEYDKKLGEYPACGEWNHDGMAWHDYITGQLASSEVDLTFEQISRASSPFMFGNLLMKLLNLEDDMARGDKLTIDRTAAELRTGALRARDPFCAAEV